ncbi:MAG: STAS domain-containing protein [Anaerolineales bacterium]|nr:STAS domain-containing protein [Anaerolineales bacterium]
MSNPCFALIARPDAAGVAVIAVRGTVTAAAEAAALQAWQAAEAAGARAVILDFSALEYMNSGGIGVLVLLLARARQPGRRLWTAGLSAHYREILALTRLDEVLPAWEPAAAPA